MQRIPEVWELTEDDIKEAIAYYLRKEQGLVGLSADDVELHVRQDTKPVIPSGSDVIIPMTMNIVSAQVQKKPIPPQ